MSEERREVIDRVQAAIPTIPESRRYWLLGYAERMADENEEASRAAADRAAADEAADIADARRLIEEAGREG